MRKIKFRAWIPQRHFMGVPFNLIQKLNQRLGGFEDDTVFMQYTGLKDKNGVEIYEGDIVTADYKVMTSRYRVGIEDGHTQLVHPALSTRYFLDRANRDIYEVIGNIHENPELMEVK